MVLQVQVGFDPESQEYVAPRQPSPYLRTLFNYIKAVNSMDQQGIMASFDERLVHTILPQVLKKPVLNYQNYGKYVQAIMPMFTGIQIQLHEVIEENHKMTVQATARATGVSGRPYLNEFILIIHFVPYDDQEMRKYGGPQYCPERKLPKMVKVKEFVDSESTLKWFKEEREWLKEQQQQNQGQGLGQGQGQGAIPGQGQGQGQRAAQPQPHVHMPQYHAQGSSRLGQGQGQTLLPSPGHYLPQGPGRAPGSLTIPNQTMTSTSVPFGFLRPSQGHTSPSSRRPLNRDRYSGV